MKKQLLLGLIFVAFCFSSCTNECMNESVNEESEVFMLDSFKKNRRILKDAAKVKRENNNLLYSLENGMEDEEQEYEMTGVVCYFGDWPKENLSWSVED